MSTTQTIPRITGRSQDDESIAPRSEADQANAQFVLVVTLLVMRYQDQMVSSDTLGGHVNNFVKAFRRAQSHEETIGLCKRYMRAIGGDTL